MTIAFLCFISCNDITHPKHCIKKIPIKGGTGEINNNATLKYDSLGLQHQYPKEGQIITSDSLNVSGIVVSFDNRTTYNPIDFSRYTLLGKYASGEGCYIFLIET